MNLLNDYAYVLWFLIIGIGFVVINTLLPLLISPRSRGERSQDPYESGEVPIGGAWIRFDIYYYLITLIFVAFSVEVVFLFPVLTIYRKVAGGLALFEIALFLGILSFAILYAWRKGIFEWH